MLHGFTKSRSDTLTAQLCSQLPKITLPCIRPFPDHTKGIDPLLHTPPPPTPPPICPAVSDGFTQQPRDKFVQTEAILPLQATCVTC